MWATSKTKKKKQTRLQIKSLSTGITLQEWQLMWKKFSPLHQSSEQDARRALLKWPPTTTATWNTRIGKISILFKSLLFWKIHLIVYLCQEKAASFYCYCIQPKTSELQDKYFHCQNPSNTPCNPMRDSNRNLLFASLWNQSFEYTATVLAVIRPIL